MLGVTQHIGFGAGVAGSESSSTDLEIVADANDVDLFTELGSPAANQEFVVSIAGGVVLGSTSTSTAALIISGSFHASATIKLIFIDDARVQGMGGAGGRGEDTPADIVPALHGGGGGGGSGTNVGAGGTATDTGVAGSNGTATAGGSGGASGWGGTSATNAATAGSDGGPAISTLRDLTIDATAGDGAVWGGGGGGAGGSVLQDGGDGGDPGEDGQDQTLSGGSTGFAVIMNGKTLTQSGTNDLRGGIDA